MKLFLLFIMSLVIAGCSTHLTRTSYSLDVGMSKQIVIEKMGLPDRRSMRGSNEAFQYAEIAGFGQCSYIIIWLSSGQVTAVTSRSGPSIAGCGLGSKEVDWGQMPKPQLDINITKRTVQ